MNKRILAATQAIANLLNNLEPPTRGCHAGDGIHIAIPADWQTRIAAGQAVAGCTYAFIDADGAIDLPERLETYILSVDISTLPAGRQAAATALRAKILAWTPPPDPPPLP